MENPLKFFKDDPVSLVCVYCTHIFVYQLRYTHHWVSEDANKYTLYRLKFSPIARKTGASPNHLCWPE